MTERILTQTGSKLKIVLVNYGLANNFGDRIEINGELANYPDLYDYILNHELNHSNKKGFTLHDLIHDIHINKKTWRILWFMIWRPKLWLEFLPIYRREKVWIYDINLFAVYCFLFAMVFSVWIIAK